MNHIEEDSLIKSYEPPCDDDAHGDFSMTETMRRYLTQRKMEEFFEDDELFWHVTPESYNEMDVQQ